MGAMGRAESVIDVELGQRSKLPGHFGVVFLLAGMEAGVLKEQNLPRLERRSCSFGNRPDAVLGKADRYGNEG